ncbi:MAG: glycosyltransferase family 39 protein, partial [Chloroflexota bacterium]
MNKKRNITKSETNQPKNTIPQVIQTGENGGEIHLHIHLDAGQQMQITFQTESLPPKTTASEQIQSMAAETTPDSEISITPIPTPTQVEIPQAIGGIPIEAEQVGSPLLDIQIGAFSRKSIDKIRSLFSKAKKQQTREEQASKPKRKINLETWLFGSAVVIYLLTRLIGLPNFPIFFFTDEAVQSVTASDFVNNGFKNPAGIFLPTYFENGGQYNLSSSVYLQIIPNLLFGKSVWVTRGTAALATLLAAFGLGLILRDIFKVRNWWLGPLLLAVVPTWFLHSRTAFETTLMVSFYTVFLYFYLRYRYDKPKHLYPALIMGALAFYAYSPGQIVLVVTGIVMFFSDIRYHWQNRKTALIGLAILALLIIPYARFRITEASEFTHHLQVLKSYWIEPIPLWEKLLNYLTRYIRGLNPAYWYLPNELDLIRHRMKGMSNIPLLTLPFALIGLWQCIKNFRSSAHRLTVFALLAAPTGAAIVDIAITRVMVLVIPATLLTALGVEAVIQWLVKQKMPENLPRLITFGTLAIFSFWMLREALVNGPLWYKDYSLYGMQYGGSQIFTEINEFHEDYPDKNIIVSPSWANGTDVIARYFLGDPMPITMGTIESYAIDYIPLDENTLFVMTPT